MLMNSFATDADTAEYLSKYSDLGCQSFVQGKAPKVCNPCGWLCLFFVAEVVVPVVQVDAATMKPVSWEADPRCEWCPPGHGDLYPSIFASGKLQELVDSGCKYVFVSNSDNLGATLDLKLLSHFAATGAPFMMEVMRSGGTLKGGG